MYNSCVFNVLLFLAISICFSCNTASQNDEQAADSLGVVTGMDSLETGITHENEIDSSFAGFYQSDFTCKDCIVVQTLLLEPDGRFILEDLRRDSLTVAREYKGNWAFSDSTIILFENKAIVGKYGISHNGIKTIERQGVILSDSVSNKNILRKKPSVLENKAWITKKQDGVSFYGIGTEPFWNVSIIWDSIISFNEMDKEPVVYKFVAPVINSDSLSFTPESNNGFSITLVHGICNDGMSDYFYDYKVIVKRDNKINSGCGFLLNKSPEFNVKY